MRSLHLCCVNINDSLAAGNLVIQVEYPVPEILGIRSVFRLGSFCRYMMRYLGDILGMVYVSYIPYAHTLKIILGNIFSALLFLLPPIT